MKFPNDLCEVSGGGKNGTCYTAWVKKLEWPSISRITESVIYSREECSNKAGVNAGSCASGFGVCCTCK